MKIFFNIFSNITKPVKYNACDSEVTFVNKNWNLFLQERIVQIFLPTKIW